MSVIFHPGDNLNLNVTDNGDGTFSLEVTGATVVASGFNTNLTTSYDPAIALMTLKYRDDDTKKPLAWKSHNTARVTPVQYAAFQGAVASVAGQKLYADKVTYNSGVAAIINALLSGLSAIQVLEDSAPAVQGTVVSA